MCLERIENLVTRRKRPLTRPPSAISIPKFTGCLSIFTPPRSAKVVCRRQSVVVVVVNVVLVSWSQGLVYLCHAVDATQQRGIVVETLSTAFASRGKPDRTNQT